MNYPIKRSAPSIAKLMQHLKVHREAAMYMRQVIHTARNTELALKAIAESESFFNHGVEYLTVNPYGCRVVEICQYINTGNTYSSTLIASNNRVYISCWGDELERYERKFGRVE